MQIEVRSKTLELKQKEEELKNSLNLCNEQHAAIKNLSIESEALRKTVKNMEGTVEFTEKEVRGLSQQNEKIQARMKKMEKELLVAKEDIHKRENRLKTAYKAHEELKGMLEKEKRRVKALREKQSQGGQSE